MEKIDRKEYLRRWHQRKKTDPKYVEARRLARKKYDAIRFARRKEQRARYYKKNKLKALEYNRRWRAENKPRISSWKKTTEARVKHMARLAVQRAIKSGKLKPKNKCEGCGNETKLQAHHPDYSKKLEVIFLCAPCHSSVHHP